MWTSGKPHRPVSGQTSRKTRKKSNIKVVCLRVIHTWAIRFKNGADAPYLGPISRWTTRRRTNRKIWEEATWFFLLDSTRIYYLMLETLRRFKVGLSQTTPLYGPKWRLHLDDLFNFSTFVLAFKIVIWLPNSALMLTSCRKMILNSFIFNWFIGSVNQMCWNHPISDEDVETVATFQCFYGRIACYFALNPVTSSIS